MNFIVSVHKLGDQFTTCCGEARLSLRHHKTPGGRDIVRLSFERRGAQEYQEQSVELLEVGEGFLCSYTLISYCN